MPSRALLLLLVASVVCFACAPPADERVVPQMDTAVLADEREVVTPLVCPGARGCTDVRGRLRAGAAHRAITPDMTAPVPMAGFTIGRTATGVHDDVESRVFVVEQGDLRVGVVSLDVIGWFQQDALRIRRAAADAGLDLDHVLVTSTHNHETKDTMGIWGRSVAESGYDEAYMAFIARQTTDALAEAVAALRPVTLRTARGDAQLLVNDTRLPRVPDGGITIIHGDDDDGVPVFSWLVWGNHPEALGSDNTLITSDYPHFLRARVQERLPGTVAVFSPGTLGGLTTPIGLTVCPADDDPARDTCPQGTFARAERLGRDAADVAVDALLEGGSVAPDALAFRRLAVEVVPENLTLFLAFNLGLLPRTVYDGDGTIIARETLALLTIEQLKDRGAHLVSEVDGLRVGDVELLGVPGELYAELFVADDDGTSRVEQPDGGDFADATPEAPRLPMMPTDARLRIVVNQANDTLGYIIPKTQWDEDAPYAYDPDGQYGEQNSLGPQTAPTVSAAVAALYALTVR
jgi:hypothetical protein